LGWNYKACSVAGRAKLGSTKDIGDPQRNQRVDVVAKKKKKIEHRKEKAVTQRKDVFKTGKLTKDFKDKAWAIRWRNGHY
jgi:putative NADH-flavin reductase